MRSLILITCFFLASIQLVNAQASFNRKINWTVAEVKEWIDSNKNNSTWRGALLYQGSDTATHHFISRIMDSWVWFRIDKASLSIKDERLYKTTSSGPLGYYYVDGLKDFVKIKDYKQE